MNLDPNIIDSILMGDCATLLAQLPDNAIPITLTSPPYDNLRDYGSPLFDFEKFKQIARELYRVTMQNGVVIWDSASNGISGTSCRQCLFFQELGFRIHDEITILKKGRRGGGIVRYGPPEKALVFSKGRPRSVNLIRDKPNKHAGKKQSYTRRKITGELQATRSGIVTAEWGIRPPVWEYTAARATAKEKMGFDHPALMVEALAEDLIVSYSRPGDLVVDPFAGAGTTLKMALLNNRRYLGLEFVHKFCSIATNRLILAEEEHLRRLEEEFQKVLS